tara:strand:- start:783 stop:1475 length:693 start_codon:yes stop_codon:yes gene_type:complete
MVPRIKMEVDIVQQKASLQYKNKSLDYFYGARADLVERLPLNPNANILEIGCSAGGTGALALSKGKCASYTGIELMPEVAKKAEAKLTKVIVADLEVNFPELKPEHFDVLIASEIFEHLRDPWRVLGQLTPLLKPGAIILASSPNISYKGVIKALIKGEFNYSDMGVMDSTHLRWFTPESFKLLFLNSGLAITDCWSLQPLTFGQKLIATLLPNGQKTFWRQIGIEAVKA